MKKLKLIKRGNYSQKIDQSKFRFTVDELSDYRNLVSAYKKIGKKFLIGVY